jgi:DNA-binding transcriptional ArsR family regulator
MSGDNKYPKEDQQLAAYAKALGHPARISILKFLSERSSCFTGDLTEVLPLAQSTTSQHLKVLKEAGLIKGEVQEPRVKYCLNQKHWSKAKKLFDSIFKS